MFVISCTTAEKNKQRKWGPARTPELFELCSKTDLMFVMFRLCEKRRLTKSKIELFRLPTGPYVFGLDGGHFVSV